MRIKHYMLLTVASLFIHGGCGQDAAKLKLAGQALARRAAQAAEGVTPLDPAWDKMPFYTAAMQLQDVTQPTLTTPGVAGIDVRGLYDDRWLVLRLDWIDSTVDTTAAPARFSDAVAVEFPTQPGSNVPDANMGQTGGSVHIVQWKADRQQKMSRTAEGTKALYPYSAIDFYVEDVPPEGPAREQMAQQYSPAIGVGNPASMHTSPVQAFVAEGFGTLTAVNEPEVRGQGTWQAGRWYVTIGIKLPAATAMTPFQVGQRTFMALAVWDGSAGNVGSRKMRTTWIPFMMEAPVTKAGL
ncbi:MAG TPA: ethylbenzene dehydrogenase-related protein [Candidatus Deferrimicrobium sp.]|nr:ethylbenzene dehydrogenase-related protein [Candidatus Deferrimicrobium sp.]